MSTPSPIHILCPACQHSFQLTASQPPKYCPLCGYTLKNEQDSSPEFLYNRYRLIEKIGKGGMGEVYKAFDSICGRSIALKRIRSDLVNHPQIRHRFLKEAHITSQLMHPAIIPIFSIQANPSATFYTMPFVEGDTLKQIIRRSRQIEKKGGKPDSIGGSIPTLMRIFITICQAVAYAHAKKIIHRDLKLENIIIGKYGEVLILDWGLAKYIDAPAEDETSSLEIVLPIPEQDQITRIGKVVGTVAYMAPERAIGTPATIQTDIYSLGVILFQLLTLKSPFKRGTLEEFRQLLNQEELIDPVLAAPYRDVPRGLANIVQKALSVDLQERYHSVNEIICELENYLGGRSDWFQVALLDSRYKQDWEFQENILIAEYIAITRAALDSEWVNLMISKQSFAGNIRIETAVCFGENTHGIGILISIPEASERTYINDGYCLWLGSDLHRTTKLLRSNVEVMQAPDIFLKRHQWTTIRIEKIDRTIYLYLNDSLQFSYIAQIPLIGTHIGLISRDADYTLNSLTISVGSLNLTVNCLAVPDAFLAHRDFAQALSEYRRIAYSFPDRVEGREALFRAGLTFIEQAKEAVDKHDLLEQALQEFEKLHKTPGGPLEYLGKALVYQALNDTTEEIKCFELAYRRYPHHPLLHVLQEQILSRMHQVSRQQRVTTYRFILLTVRHFNSTSIDAHTKRLITSLQKHWEPLPFFEEYPLKNGPQHLLQIAVPLAFWLDQHYILGEIIDDFIHSESPSVIEINNALTCMLEMGSWEYAKEKLAQVKNEKPELPESSWEEVEQMLGCHENPLEQTFKNIFITRNLPLTFSQKRMCLHALAQALDQGETRLIHKAINLLKESQLTFDTQLRLNTYHIWAYLLEKNWNEARKIFDLYPAELLNSGSTPLHFLYGCWLQGVEGKEMAMIHFMGLQPTTYPRSWTLGSYELTKELSQHGWHENAFLWEKRELYRQLALYYHCADDEFQREYYKKLLNRAVMEDEI